MEIFILGRSMRDPAFIQALHAVLRLLIDEEDVKTFNVAIFGIGLSRDPLVDDVQAMMNDDGNSVKPSYSPLLCNEHIVAR